MTIKFKTNYGSILTIHAEDTVSIGELIDKLMKYYPNGEWRDFKLDMIEEKVPVYPTYPVWPPCPTYPDVPAYPISPSWPWWTPPYTITC